MRSSRGIRKPVLPKASRGQRAAIESVSLMAGNSQDSRFDRRLNEILSHATDVFYEKGYEGASMRDLSRATGMSLAGLYHYFENKEKLLYLIQRHTFRTILDQLRDRLATEPDPTERVKVFIRNHLEYFIANMKAMKVLSHEDDMLKGQYGEEIQAIKREYYHTCLELVSALAVDAENSADVRKSARRARSGCVTGSANRTAVLSLFGMMNWIYTWYNPRLDGDAETLSRQMASMFLRGVVATNRDAELEVSKSV